MKNVDSFKNQLNNCGFFSETMDLKKKKESTLLTLAMRISTENSVFVLGI